MVFSLRRGLVVALLLSVTPDAFSQQPPRVGYVYPAGGRQGTTFQVTVGGQFLEGAGAARVSSEGVEASVLEYIKPLSPGQASELRSKLQELMKKQQDARTAGLSRRSAATRPAWTPQDARQLEDIRARLARFVRRPSSPAIAVIASSYPRPPNPEMTLEKTGTFDAGADGYAQPDELITYEFVVTNTSAYATINRASGLTVTWTGGDPDTLVFINGSSYVADQSGKLTGAAFQCYENNTAGRFTVPASVLQQLPASAAISAGGFSFTMPGSLGLSSIDPIELVHVLLGEHPVGEVFGCHL